MARTSNRRSGRAGRSARTGQSTTRRQSARKTSGRTSSARGQQKNPQQNVMVIGAVIGGLILVVGLALLVSGRSRRAKPRGPATSGGRMTAEEGARLKREGNGEMAAGFAAYETARPGSPTEQQSLRDAREHLQAAEDLFNRAKEGLPGDPTLDSSAQRCAGKRYDCQKRMTIDIRR